MNVYDLVKIMNTCMEIKCFEWKIKMYRRNINWYVCCGCLWSYECPGWWHLQYMLHWLAIIGNIALHPQWTSFRRINIHLHVMYTYINWGNEVKVSGLFANPKVNETNDCLLNNCLETPAIRESMNHVAKH